jgi:hypothetical protein
MSVKFNETRGQNVFCKAQKDPNFALQRKELEFGVQAVAEATEKYTQTNAQARQVNSTTQYAVKDFESQDTVYAFLWLHFFMLWVGYIFFFFFFGKDVRL